MPTSTIPHNKGYSIYIPFILSKPLKNTFFRRMTSTRCIQIILWYLVQRPNEYYTFLACQLVVKYNIYSALICYQQSILFPIFPFQLPFFLAEFEYPEIYLQSLHQKDLEDMNISKCARNIYSIPYY